MNAAIDGNQELFVDCMIKYVLLQMLHMIINPIQQKLRRDVDKVIAQEI
jgi:DNA-binding cell septation regulator SpoVG